MNVHMITAAINADPACINNFIQGTAWTAVPGKERVYLKQATGPSLKRWSDVGHITAAGVLVGVPSRIERYVEPLIEVLTASFAASVVPAPAHPTAHDPAFHAAVRRGEAALYGTEADLIEAVNAGHVSVSDAMNQDF